MFTRRHPFLFFVLVLVGIISVTSIVNSIFSGFAGRGETASGPKVGVIEIKEIIMDAEPVIESLKSFRNRDQIKAIVIRVDSPGGAVGPAQEIYREIRKTIEVKPVIASMGTIAASGGYYVASATNGIMASRGTITGSIGVIMEMANFRELFEKIGIYPVVIKSGAYKDIGSPLRDISEAEQELLQEFVDAVHRQFVEDVAAGRGMPQEEVARVADGRIFPGQKAQALGLIDKIGNMADAVEWAGREGGIKGEIEKVYPPEDKFSVFRKLLEVATNEMSMFLHQSNTRTISGGYMYNPSP